LLPDGDSMLFSVATGTNVDQNRVVVESWKSRRRPVVIDGGSNAHYLATGHLVYVRGAKQRVPTR
jgi:hypothetical protein